MSFQSADVYLQTGVTRSAVTQFPVILLNDLWAWPYNVIRPRPLRLSELWRVVNGRPMDLQKIWGAFWHDVYCTGQRNDFELIPTVQMETRHPIEG